ncbi:kinase suppressor of Ras 2 [Tulasnella sp. 424]|nr:kinase suppressor of Ras 2 [Tulasnella sp. 424]KAG8975432.1 kinase suppressor of Ras 2 [Tulasnella sp. 425]
MPVKKSKKCVKNLGPYAKRENGIHKRAAERRRVEAMGAMEVDDQVTASSFEQEAHQPTQSPNAIEDKDPEPIWRLFGESLAPESAPQSGDPGWAVFRTIVPAHEVMKSVAWFEGTVCVKVAVKRLRHPNVRDPTRPVATNIAKKYEKKLRKEVQVWMRLRHENIAPLLGYIDKNDFCMISPWFDKGNSIEYLHTTKPGMRARFRLTEGVAAGVTYLHTLSPTVIHGDLKPDNIVVDKHDVPHIIDFGLSKALEEGSDLQSSSSNQAGNSRWVAPERLEGSTRTTNSDVYSFASVAFFIMTEILPFGNYAMVDFRICYARSIEGRQPMEPGVLYLAIEGIPGFHDLLSSCWAVAPAERPSMPTVINTLASF